MVHESSPPACRRLWLTCKVGGDGRSNLRTPQANNRDIFPGVGLGILASEASHVTDEMFAAAAKALDSQVSREDFALGRIYPSLARICEVSLTIALAVAKVAFAQGLTALPEPADLLGHIKAKMYDPTYRAYI
jgi:malate dehydrogenase (oxaloacetate-decarboxylating)(NADP+)